VVREEHHQEILTMDGRIFVGLALAGAAIVGSRRGSRADGTAIAGPLSEIQTQMLRVKNTYKTDPETAIRALDLIVTQIPGAGSLRTCGMPGIHHSVKSLIADAADLGPNRDNLDAYMEELARQIREDRHFASGKEAFTLKVNWDRARYISWIGREVARLVKQSRSDKTPGGRKKTASEQKKHEQLKNALVDMRDKLAETLDWIVSTRQDVSGLSFAQAKAQSDAWHTAQAQARRAQAAQQQARMHQYTLLPERKASLTGEVLYKFKDGWTMQRLTERRMLHEEARGILHHCAADGGYWDKLQRGQMVSLRDAENRPYMTLTMSDDGARLENAQGFYDRDLGHNRGRHSALSQVYTPLFPEGMDLDDVLATECAHVIEFLEHVGGGRANLGRHGDCVQIVAAWKAKQEKAKKQKAAKKGSTAGRRRSPWAW
jgi:hypothetical protein